MKIKVSRTVNAPAEGLWQYVGDFSNIYRFHPFLKGSHFIDGATSNDIGSTRQCNFKDGNYVKEQIIEWKEGSLYTVDIIESSIPIKYGKGTVGISPIDENNTEVFMELDVTPKNKLMAPMMYLMYKRKVVPAILQRLEEVYTIESKTEANLNLA